VTRWGVLLPTLDPLRAGGPPRVVEAARLAERLGFDAVWAGDHLACPAPVLDAPQCLAAAAAATERVGLGLSVMLLALRPLAWTAKQLATLDALSGGRLRLGAGVGGEFPQEFAAAGVPLRERGARVDAALAALPDLLTGRPSGDIPALAPAMAAPPPILVGGRSDAALRRAARFGDAWLPMWISPGTLAGRAERLAELAAGFDRPRPELALLIGVHVGDGAARAADAHLRGLYGLGLERVARWTALGDRDAVAEHLDAHIAAGVSEIVLMPLGGDPLAQFERLAAVRESVERGGARVPL
jgi:alkanesulfonate monooxygenase SsuD/methylene tetrahydromethanopterin reductase-like flavin-dependent oxidoreductase (luciferase family)